MNQVTFSPTIDRRLKKQDGSYNVRIRITFKRLSRYIPTTLYAFKNDLTASFKIKQGTLLTRCYALIGEFQGYLSGLSPFALLQMNVDDVVKMLRLSSEKDYFSLNFITWCEEAIQRKSPGARHNYRIALNSFKRFLNSDSIDINKITAKMLQEFSLFLDNEVKYHGNAIDESGDRALATSVKKKKGGASRRYIKSLATLYHEAQFNFNNEDEDHIVIPKDPFARVVFASKPCRSAGQHSLSLGQMQAIISAQTDDPGERMALDVFVLSFGLMGANLADLYSAAPVKRKSWTYNRQKTKSRRADGGEMRVCVPDCLAPFLKRLEDTQGRKWLRLYQINPDKDRVNSKLNRWLRRWQKRCDLEDFTLYAARHTWATIAHSKAHIEKARIDECLAHSGNLNMADTYVEKDWDLLDEANRMVLALFKWPGE